MIQDALDMAGAIITMGILALLLLTVVVGVGGLFWMYYQFAMWVLS